MPKLNVKKYCTPDRFGKQETVEFDGQTLWVGTGYGGRIGSNLSPDQFDALRELVTNHDVVEYFEKLRSEK